MFDKNIIVQLAIFFGGFFTVVFFMKSNLIMKMRFVGHIVQEIGVVYGGIERPNDKITIYRLTSERTKKVSWCLNIITKSRKFHGSGRAYNEMPIFLGDDEMSAIIESLSKQW